MTVMTVGREEVPRLLDDGAPLVEVLPAELYQQLHPPGAINLPLKELAELAPQQLDPSRPAIVHCNNYG